MARCRCGSAKQYKRCCRPAHQGGQVSDVEALMRSRYVAYAMGLVDYILETTHPAGPQFQSETGTWRAEVQRFSDHTAFRALRVVSVEPGETVGFVVFHAELEQDGRDASFGERSRFERLGGRWLYHSGERL